MSASGYPGLRFAKPEEAYLERIVEHAAMHWDCYIPPPDPNWREKAEADLAAEAVERVRRIAG